MTKKALVMFRTGPVGEHRGVPLVRCVKRGPRLFFLCPYCNEVRQHGSVEKPGEIGTRVGHCRGRKKCPLNDHYAIFYEDSAD